MKYKFKAKLAISASMLTLIANQNFAKSNETKNEKPNFLWLTFEDCSPYQFSCYGNKDIKTPNVDALAHEGIMFTNAYSCAPHCSAARSSLIIGNFATTYGMDFHSISIQTPNNIFYPKFLRDNGYYTTNNKKTHYNSKNVNLKEEWNACSDLATYADKERGDRPFFSVFNFLETHMSRIRGISTEGRRDFTELGIDEDKISLPPHLPNLPAMRSDQARMYETVLSYDLWVKAFVDDLKAKGLYEDTIIFLYSDHGGNLSRGKGYPFEGGLKVPMIIRVPEKWQKEFDFKAGTVDNRLIGFEDLAPTVLSMAGIEIPKHMTGTAHYGKYKSEKEKEVQFCFRTNQEHNHFDPCRTATDGKWKYIRNYIPYKPILLRNFFQWGMPGNLAWDAYKLSGKSENEVWTSVYEAKPSEMLFDLESDPWEINNLAGDAKYKKTLEKFRKLVSNNIRNTKDLGFFPIGLKHKANGLYNYVRDVNYPLDEMYDLVEIASSPNKKDLKTIRIYLKSTYPELQYWAAVALANLASRNQYNEIPKELLSLQSSANLEVLIAAYDAIARLGNPDLGIEGLMNIMANDYNPAYSSLEAMTWEPNLKKAMQKFIPRLKEFTQSDRGQLAIKGRSILINLGAMELDELYTDTDKAKALLVNQRNIPTDHVIWLKEMEEKVNAKK